MSSAYRVRIRAAIVLAGQGGTPDPGLLEEHADRVLKHLRDLIDRVDKITTDDVGVFDFFAVIPEANTPTEAVLEASSSLRTAAHAAGAYTPGWPSRDDWDMWLSEREVEAVPVSVDLIEIEAEDRPREPAR